ncbi:MAG: hypothetical protein QM754_10120 [Tepidisphaeraceae bacterium]
MSKRRRRHPLKFALYANAVAVGLVGLVLWNKSETPSLLPAALAQQPQPIAGGAGLYLMPAQLATNTWGCYVMDVDRQTLLVYQYQIGSDANGAGRMLKLIAARDFTYDRRLRDFNTLPKPSDIKGQVESAEIKQP